MPDLFEECRLTLVTEPYLLVEGKVQNVDNVIHVLARRLENRTLTPRDVLHTTLNEHKLPIRIGSIRMGHRSAKIPERRSFSGIISPCPNPGYPVNGFGPDNFLVGTPDFHFSDYEEWIKSRFAPRHYQKLKEKMGAPSLYAMGAFIQSLGQNPGIEDNFASWAVRPSLRWHWPRQSRHHLQRQHRALQNPTGVGCFLGRAGTQFPTSGLSCGTG